MKYRGGGSSSSFLSAFFLDCCCRGSEDDDEEDDDSLDLLVVDLFFRLVDFVVFVAVDVVVDFRLVRVLVNVAEFDPPPLLMLLPPLFTWARILTRRCCCLLSADAAEEEDDVADNADGRIDIIDGIRRCIIGKCDGWRRAWLPSITRESIVRSVKDAILL